MKRILALPFVVTAAALPAGAQPEAIPADPPQAPTPKAERHVVQHADGTCTEYFHDNCPPTKRCNPPPPRKVPCPEDVLPEARPNEKVYVEADGRCTAMPMDFKCHPGATCNPPPPRPVRCPPAAPPEAPPTEDGRFAPPPPN